MANLRSLELAHPVPLVAGEDALLRVFVVADSQEQIPMPKVCADFYVEGTKLGSWCERAEMPTRPDWSNRLTSITLSGPEGVTGIERESGQSTALPVDRITGRVRGLLRDWPSPGESLTAARRTLPGPGLDVTISNGIPGPADWIR